MSYKDRIKKVFGKLKFSGVPVVDPNDICVELYNPSDEDVLFTEDHPHPNSRLLLGLTMGPKEIILKAKEWCLLPHQYYIGKKKSGAPITVIKNYGAAKFQGNTKASAPENWKKSF